MEDEHVSKPLLRDDVSLAHKTAHWLSNQNVPLHRMKNESDETVEAIREIITQCLPATIPEGMHPPYCQCGELCQFVHDTANSEDGAEIPIRVWVCAGYRCFHMQVFEEDHVQDISTPCHIAEKFNHIQYMDLDESLGTLLFDQIHPVDRYTTLWDIMGLWGDSFADSFFRKLEKVRDAEMIATGQEEVIVYPQGSKVMPVGAEFDAFCSYRWQTGRTSLHFTFCGLFTMPIIWCVMVFLYPILVVIFYLIVQKTLNHHYNNETFSGDASDFYKNRHVMALGWCDAYRCFWWWFEIVGPIVLFVILMFGAQVVYGEGIFALHGRFLKLFHVCSKVFSTKVVL